MFLEMKLMNENSIHIYLSEWEKCNPENNSELERVFLEKDTIVRKTAQELSQRKILEIRGLRDGLSVRSFSSRHETVMLCGVFRFAFSSSLVFATVSSALNSFPDGFFLSFFRIHPDSFLKNSAFIKPYKH